MSDRLRRSYNPTGDAAMRPSRWKNCDADGSAWRHGQTVRSFYYDVIAPAIRTVEEKIAAISHRNNPGDEFACADMTYVLRETKLAFSLSVQSIWERQFRSYLRTCAEELKPDKVRSIEEAKVWRELY